MKYQPLRRYLEGVERVAELGFADIERIIGAPLPPSAWKHAAWWSNSGLGHVNAQAWLGAGFKAEGVDLAAGRIAFRRVNRQAESSTDQIPGTLLERIRERLGGTVIVAHGVDLTDPLWLFEQDDL